MLAWFGLLRAITYNSRPTSSAIMDPALKLNFLQKYYFEHSMLTPTHAQL